MGVCCTAIASQRNSTSPNGKKLLKNNKEFQREPQLLAYWFITYIHGQDRWQGEWEMKWVGMCTMQPNRNEEGLCKVSTGIWSTNMRGGVNSRLSSKGKHLGKKNASVLSQQKLFTLGQEKNLPEKICITLIPEEALGAPLLWYF